MSRTKMEAARELIQEKRYAEARAILRTVDHDKAREWLAKLDKIAPEAKPKSGPRSLLLIMGVIVGLAIILGIGLLYVRNSEISTTGVIVGDRPTVTQTSLPTATITSTPRAIATFQGGIQTETYSVHGVSFRYPADWTNVTDSLAPIELRLPDTNIDNAFMEITSERIGGRACNDSESTPFSVSGISGKYCAYNFSDRMGKIVEVELSANTLLQMKIITSAVNWTNVEPLFDQVVNSINIDPSEVSEWWVAAPPIHLDDYGCVAGSSIPVDQLKIRLAEAISLIDDTVYDPQPKAVDGLRLAGTLYGQYTTCIPEAAFNEFLNATQVGHRFTYIDDIYWTQFWWGWKEAHLTSPTPASNSSST